MTIRKPSRSTGLVQSFKCAFAGVWTMLRSQRNARIHLLATAIVILIGFLLGLPWSGWCWLVSAITIVWMAESLNTAFETVADVIAPEYHPLVKRSKDLAAGAVLIAVIGAVVIGILVLGPLVMNLME